MGARTGAPDAQQGADRWHLLKNVGEVLERVLHQHRRAIDDAVSLDEPESAEATTAEPVLVAADAAADAADPTVLLGGPATSPPSAVETSSAESPWKDHGRRARWSSIRSAPSTPRGSRSGR
ncbi:MAG: hypothetical protein Q8S73_44335 [Deltaproteobacteria bacterium]|nr:hypothetical protein [Myxococcales bacterium]MDP3221194.1 hypothetical protein [Deltaproteobacteria bacterium]